MFSSFHLKEAEGVLTGNIGSPVSVAAINSLIREAGIGHQPRSFTNLLRRIAISVTKDAIVKFTTTKVSLLVLNISHFSSF